MKQKTDNTFKGKKNYNVVSKINNGLKKDVNEVVIHPSKFEKPKTTSNSNFNNYKNQASQIPSSIEQSRPYSTIKDTNKNPFMLTKSLSKHDERSEYHDSKSQRMSVSMSQERKKSVYNFMKALDNPQTNQSKLIFIKKLKLSNMLFLI